MHLAARLDSLVFQSGAASKLGAPLSRGRVMREQTC